MKTSSSRMTAPPKVKTMTSTTESYPTTLAMSDTAKELKMLPMKTNATGKMAPLRKVMMFPHYSST